MILVKVFARKVKKPEKECLMRSPECRWCADDITFGDVKNQRIKCGTITELEEQKCGNILEYSSHVVSETKSNRQKRADDEDCSDCIRFGAEFFARYFIRELENCVRF